VAAAANALNLVVTAGPTPASTTKTLPAGAGGKGGDKDGPIDGAATAGAGQAQPAANPSQPVAMGLVVNGTLATTPAAANASAARTVSHAKATVPFVGGQDAPQAGDVDAATDPTSANPQSTPAGNDSSANTANTADSASAGNAANATAPDASLARQAQMQADNSVVLGQAEAGSQGGTDRAAQPGNAATGTVALDSAGLSGAHAAPGAANADTLPNFGFSAVNATVAPQATPTSATASTQSVPIAGLAVAIVSRAQAGSNQFDIRLDPPELGRIDVRLDVDRSGQVTSHVTVDRADTLQLLQSQQPQLERALEQAGLKTADNGLQFTLRDQSFAGQNGGTGGGQQNAAQLVIPDPELAPIDTTQIYSRWSVGGGVDIRV
jgi:chemotaxis protein MotD